MDTTGSSEDGDRGTRAHALGEALLSRYNRMYSTEDLDAAIDAHRTAFEASPAGSPYESAYMLATVYALQQRFALRGDTSDCDTAIAMFHRMLSDDRSAGIAPNQRGVLLVGLGLALKERYLATGNTSDLVATAAAFRSSASQTHSGSPFRIQLLSGLGHALSLLHRFTANETYRAEALWAYTQIAESMLVDQGMRDHALTARARLQLHNDVAPLPEPVVRCGELAEEAAQARANYRTSGELNELNRAITFTGLLLPLTSPNDSSYVSHLLLLGEDLLERYERTGWDADPGQALTAATRAEESASDPRSLAAALCTAANAWLANHHVTNELEALNCAIAAATRSLEIAPPDEPGRAWSHNALGISLMRRYEEASDVRDARRGAESFRQALTLVGPTSSDGRPIRNNLAAALRSIYEHTTEIGALDESIEILRMAASTERPPSVAELANLGNAYMNRYYFTTDTVDADRALRAYQGALEGLPSSDVNYPIVAYGLFEAVTSEPGRDPDTIGQVIRCTDNMIKNYPSDGMLHHRRGILLRERFQRTRNRDDLQEAVKAWRMAAMLTPSSHSQRFNMLAGLAYALRDRHEELYDIADLVEAETLARQCIAGLPPRNSLGFALRVVLKLILEARLQAAPEMPVEDEVLRLASEISASPAAPTLVRALEARDAAVIYAERGEWRHAAERFELAVNLLPFIAPDHDLREGVRVLRPGRTAADGAACWLNADEPDRAAVLLELGRAVFLSRTSARRAELAKLRVERPDLADKFEMLRSRLDRPDRPEVTIAGPWEKPGPAVDRGAAAAEFEAVLAAIRSLPGQERFLLPLNVDELLAACTEGPIVMLNASNYRCDAVILTSRGVQTIPLREVTLRDVADNAVHIQLAGANAYDLRRSEEDQEYLQEHAIVTLTWLWSKVVEPVLKEIGITTRRTGERWPRIWWIPGGEFAWLPIHAAGYHDRRNATDAPALLDRAQSSYVPSVSMLIQARARIRQAAEPGKIIVIAMPKTPGAADLPSAEAEAQVIANRFPVIILGTAQRAQRAATRKEVMRALAAYPIVHFACHAEADWADSWRSFLAIQSNQPEAANAVGELRLTDIASLDLQGQRLACLSACATTRPTDMRLLDEALHLTSGFLLAGFTHVSGTLWEVEDDASAAFAQKMYDSLEASPSVADLTRTALAVHEATLALREGYTSTPLLWASHIYVGP